MLYSLAYLLGLILAPLVAHIRGWQPASLFFATAFIYVAFGAISFAQAQYTLNQFRNAEPMTHDTYFIVNHGYYMMNLGFGMAIIGAIIWAQTKFGGMRHPTLTKALFWLFHLAVMGSTTFLFVFAFFIPKPRTYIDYAEYFETYNLIGAWSAILAQAAVFGLLALLIWSTVARALAR